VLGPDGNSGHWSTGRRGRAHLAAGQILGELPVGAPHHRDHRAVPRWVTATQAKKLVWIDALSPTPTTHD